MKFAIATIVQIGICVAAVEGFAVPFSLSSSKQPKSYYRIPTKYRNSQLYYENSRESSSSSSDSANVWTVLAHTEKWISETLASTETENGNPYSRKEVTYVCETQKDSPMIVANMFKRLREARELGENHGKSEEDRMVEQKNKYRPHTLRQTQVMVIPGNPALLESFQTFDNFMVAVNTARRNARDYITDMQSDKVGQESKGESPREWSVSVNCAHLHPKFGEKTPEEELQDLKDEEAAGEVDVNEQQMREMRTRARQSPYPTIVLEVRAEPPQDWRTQAAPRKPQVVAEIPVDEDDDDDVTSDYYYNRKELLSKTITPDDIRKLEALFGKAAVVEKNVADGGMIDHKDDEDAFYAAIEDSLESVSSISHMRRAQEWIQSNDEKFSPITSTFTESDTTEVDRAYEFVFINMAMQKEQARMDKVREARRQYLIMPHFLSSSATSLEKFSKEVANIVNTLPDLRDRVKVSTFHPEHISEARRSPMPILCLEWNESELP